MLVCRSSTVTGNTTTHKRIPITTPERALMDLAPVLGARDLARAVHGACRLKLTTPSRLFVALATSPAGAERG